MKNKIRNCKVNLVSESKDELQKWMKEIKNTFEGFFNTDIRVCFFESENITDYRTTVLFHGIGSKDSIYKKMNAIKANPIIFQ